VKIYSNRVDDTYSSSHRILESLSRNGTSHADEGHDDVDDGGAEDGEAPEGGRKKATKTSTRLNIATTIERNVSALNAVKLENDVAVDPMFHKISKAFDEGGAKGMLMNNLVSVTCCVVALLCFRQRRECRMAVGLVQFRHPFADWFATDMLCSV
jgi:condensin complex subunit 2